MNICTLSEHLYTHISKVITNSNLITLSNKLSYSKWVTRLRGLGEGCLTITKGDDNNTGIRL